MDFPPELTEDPYYHLAQTGPYAPVIGAALHHHGGAARRATSAPTTAGTRTTTTTPARWRFPWMYAGRRYVAPVPYQEVRYPEESAIAQPIEAGKYMSIYWITEGRYDEPPAVRPSAPTTVCSADGRVYKERDHTFHVVPATSGPSTATRDGPARLSTRSTTRTRGLVVEVIDAKARTRGPSSSSGCAASGARRSPAGRPRW